MQGAGLAHHGDNLQDILRILTLWFNYGALPDVEQALQDGFNRVTVDTWLVVIPQARPTLRCGLPKPMFFLYLRCSDRVLGANVFIGSSL